MFTSAETERLLVVVSVLLLYGISLLVIATNSSDRQRAVFATALLAAILLLATAIAARWVREQQGPFLTMYDILLSNLFSLMLIYFVICRFGRAFRASTVVVVPFLAMLGSWLLLTPPEAEPLPPTFDNPWLWLHVVSGKFFFALCMTAAATSIVLYRNVAKNSASIRTGLSRRIDISVWQLVSLAFVFQSVMLVTGAIWAHSAWGRYWAWDALETWALLTWLCLGLLLHLRVTFRRLPTTFLWAGNVIVFALAFLTFLGIPFVSIAPHKGVM